MTTYTFEVTEQEANMILSGLGELQAKHSLPLIQKLQFQANAQNNARAQQAAKDQATAENANG